MNRHNLVCLVFGAAFGFLFSAAGFNQYDVVHQTLRLQDLDPFFVMGSAVLTAMPLLWLLERRRFPTRLGGALQLRRWAIEPKQVYGGLIFGAGWAVTGACPSTISGMLAAGSLLGIVPLARLLAGIVLRDAIAERQSRATERVVALQRREA